MKKKIAIILSCTMLIGSLFGCGNNKNGGSSDKTTMYEESDLQEGIDLRTELGVPDSVKETWTSNSGITIINVDAPVYFPEITGAVPTIEVTLRNPTKDEVLNFAEAVFEGKAYYPTIYDSDSNEFKRISMDEVDIDGKYFITFDSEEKRPEKGDAVYYATISIIPGNNILEFYRHHVTESVDYSSVSEVALQSNGWAKNTSLSPEDARAHADQIIQAFAPYMECVEVSACIGLNKEVEDISTDDQGERLDTQGYTFHYMRSYAGIPSTYTDEECSETEGNPDNYAPSCYYESAMVTISEYGLERVEWRQPYQVGDTLNKNVKLLSFDEVKQIATKMLPLKYASYEQYYNPNEVSVEKIKFGYMRVLMKDDPTRYMVIPVWDFIGNYDSTIGSSDRFTNHWLITVNAVDGTIIDREYGY